MSLHSLKSKRRHPDAPRERVQVGHVTFEIGPEAGTFALIAGEAAHATDRQPLFAGFIERGMAAQLRGLADRIEDIERVQKWD